MPAAAGLAAPSASFRFPPVPEGESPPPRLKTIAQDSGCLGWQQGVKGVKEMGGCPVQPDLRCPALREATRPCRGVSTFRENDGAARAVQMRGRTPSTAAPSASTAPACDRPGRLRAPGGPGRQLRPGAERLRFARPALGTVHTSTGRDGDARRRTRHTARPASAARARARSRPGALAGPASSIGGCRCRCSPGTPFRRGLKTNVPVSEISTRFAHSAGTSSNPTQCEAARRLTHWIGPSEGTRFILARGPHNRRKACSTQVILRDRLWDHRLPPP